MSYTYTSFKAALAELMVVNDPNDPDFIAILPSIIDYAEQRLYRELDLINTVVRDSSGVLVSGSRNFTLPTASGTFVTVLGINAVSPAGTTPDNGTRNPLAPTSRDVLDILWSSSTGSGLPTLFAMITQGTLIVGPWPDNPYTIEVIGTIRPAPLSVSNTTTFLSLNLPDIFIAASMVFASGYMRNFGSQADDPGMSQSWETQYGKLFQSANVEEMRKKFQSQAWSSQQPAPLATPPRA